MPLLASLLSLPLPEDRYPPLTLTPQQQKQQTQDAIIAITLEAAERQPLLQLWEDLHWADPSTLELLGLLIEQAPTASLLMVLTARPEFVPPWPARSHITPITLNRLERPHAEALVARIAGTKPLPAEVVDHIVTKTDGVPLYVEELTKTILASDILRDTGARYELTGPAVVAVDPRHVAGIADGAARPTAAGARTGPAWLGARARVCLRDDLRSLHLRRHPAAGGPEPARRNRTALPARPAAAGPLRLQARAGAGRRLWIAAAALPPADHLQVAELLETRFPEMVETHPELMAHHLSEAGQAERAVGYWLKAGQRAVRVSANAEAFGNLTRGLEQVALLPEGATRDERELDLQIALLPPLMVTKGYSAPETKATSERAIALCRQTGQVSRIFPALYGQVAHLYVSGQIDRYRELAAEFLDLASAQPEIVPRVVGHRMMGTSSLVAGLLPTAMHHLEQAWAMFDPERDAESALVYGQDLGTGASSYLCLGSALGGHPERAQIWGHKAVARGRDVKHVNTQCYALTHAALAAYVTGDRTTIEQHIGQLQLLTNEHGLPVWRASGLPMQGALLGWQGRPEDGLANADQGSELMAGLQFKLFLPIFSLIRAELQTGLGRTEDALATIADGLAVTAETGEHWGDAELHRVRGELLVSMSKEGEAEAEFDKSLTVAREQGARWWELRTATSLARLWSQKDRRAEARELLAEVFDGFTEGFDTDDLKAARTLLDELA